MAKSRDNPERKEPAGFKPRRTVVPIGEPDEKRVVVRAYMPASLAKDITLYAIERDCSVSDLLNSVLRKAIPSLKVVATAGKTPVRMVGPESADDDDDIAADVSAEDNHERGAGRHGAAA